MAAMNAERQPVSGVRWTVAALLPVAFAIAIVVYAVAGLRALPPPSDVAAWDKVFQSVRGVSQTTIQSGFLVCLAVLVISIAAVRSRSALMAGLAAAGLAVGLVGAGAAYEVHRTALNPTFLANELEGADTIAMVKGFTSTSKAFTPDLAAAVNATLSEERTWVQNETRRIIGVVLDYLTGHSDALSITINPAPLLTTLLKHLGPSLLATMPPETTPEEKQAALAQMQDNMTEQAKAIADHPFDLSTLSKDQQAAVVKARGAMPYVRWLTIGSVALVVQFMLVLLLVRSPRWVGVSAAIAGVVILIGGLIGGMQATKALAQLPSTLPPTLTAYLPTFVSHLQSPLRMFAIGCVIVGLLIAAVGGRRRAA